MTVADVQPRQPARQPGDANGELLYACHCRNRTVAGPDRQSVSVCPNSILQGRGG